MNDEMDKKTMKTLLAAVADMEALEEGSGYDAAKERWLAALAQVPEGYYDSCFFSYETAGRLYIYRNPRLVRDNGAWRVVWTMTTERGTILKTDFPGLSLHFEKTMARNITGEAEASLSRRKRALLAERRRARLLEAVRRRDETVNA